MIRKLVRKAFVADTVTFHTIISPHFLNFQYPYRQWHTFRRIKARHERFQETLSKLLTWANKETPFHRFDGVVKCAALPANETEIM